MTFFARFRALPRIRPYSQRTSTRTAIAFITIGSALTLTGRRIKCDHGSLVDPNQDEGDVFPSRFRKPKWTENQYISADELLAGGPSWWPAETSGIDRCDALTIASNFESEDFISAYFGNVKDPEDGRTYIGLFDGHNGSATAEFLSVHLMDLLQRTLAKLPQQYEYSENLDLHVASPSEDDSVNETIKHIFREVDEAIIDPTDVLSSPSKTNAVRTLREAYAGSCALVSVYEPDIRLLRVALAGDSRAVLGRRIKGKDGKDTYAVHVLSHPGEKVVDKGRVMGWGPSRAFGDAAYKWSIEIQKQLHQKFLGDRPMSDDKTPPYLTAEPEIKNFVVKHGDFLIMASDGLWDCLTSEEAVGLIGVWLGNNEKSVHTDHPRRDYEGQNKEDRTVYQPKDLPVKLKQKDDTANYRWWKAEKQFVNVDRNAAAHLIRNAFGGADNDLTNALLSMTAPRSRRYRDDISVVVTFFR
uniref:PPM-type phosphatase domain-containing protein n=1 Tax=Moniliophthora roreri TaxID=221103 RepID=A0A0W0GDB1_MONRR